MIHQLNIHGKDKVQVAIDRLKAFEQKYSEYAELAGIFMEVHKAERLFGGIEAIQARKERK